MITLTTISSSLTLLCAFTCLLASVSIWARILAMLSATNREREQDTAKILAAVTPPPPDATPLELMSTDDILAELAKRSDALVVGVVKRGKMDADPVEVSCMFNRGKEAAIATAKRMIEIIEEGE